MYQSNNTTAVVFPLFVEKGNVNDEHNRKGIINNFLRKIYLWDDKFTMILNGGDRPIDIDG